MTTTTERAGLRTGIRAATAGAPLVARRRSLSDAGLLALTAVVLAVTVALSLLVPSVVARAADEAVEQAVVDAGTSADVVARIGAASGVGFGQSMSTVRDPNAAATLRRDAAAVHDALPTALRDVTGPGAASVATPIVHGRVGTTAITTRLAYVGDPDEARQAGLVQWVEGTAPAPAELPAEDPDATGLPLHEVEVGMQADAAARFGVRPGDRAKLSLYTYGPVDLVVTGLYTVPDPEDRVWSQFPDLLAARDAASPGQAGHVALLVTDASLPDAKLVIQARALVTQVRYSPDAALVDAGTAPAITTAVTQVQADPSPLSQAAGYPVTVTTQLGSTLDAISGRLAAARAQQSVLVLGLSGVGALVLVLAAKLLVARRETYLLAERARGASIASVAVRALLESVPIAVVAGCAGALVASLLLPSDGSGTGVAVALVVIAALTPALVAALQVRTAYSGRRTAANRSDRNRVRARGRARRVVAEATLIAIAVGAVVSVRRRGLAQTSTGGVDLLLAATPLLVAAAATLVVARVLPPLLRALSRAARTRRGLVPVVATARASAASGTAVPLLTLTVAIGLVVFCGTTVLTIAAGQSAAADARTGADVRVEGPLTDQDVTDLRGEPGVTAVAGIAVVGGRTIGMNSGTTADLILVDAEPLATIEETHGRSGTDLRLLTTGDPTTPAALVSPSISAAVALVTPDVQTNAGRVGLDVVGVVGDEPRVRTDGSGAPVDGRVLVDRATFDDAQGVTSEPTTILVDGPGALAATQALHLEGRPGVTVVDRDEWLQEWRDSPLNRDLVLLLLAASVALAAYAALALVLMVAATSRERGRALSALRTLGLDARTASALTFAELLPVAAAAVLGGTAIGILIPWLTSGALGLELATGGFAQPPLRIGWWPVLGAVAVIAVALVVTVLVESAVRRRDKLGEVLRVGER
ncbi:FtsX-like permease family protein [Cellulomonas sp. PhB150]|uniref:FtsX-like permease family protein n=1 Tax=Cellulomonas sp. PhB150 TaxID=2485188 RepID=UPI000F4A260B|nr:FtsX-like permease family protein [Cellulomonas sp. PhB150]ROS23038.1 putative ABC transport system permease protein [Cellulomonas sp. PhB150]